MGLVVDTSAIMAIMLREPGHEELLERLETVMSPRLMSAATRVELGIVSEARDRPGGE